MKYSGAAIILGAGASNAALVAGGEKPPLDSDFLRITEKFFSRKRAIGDDAKMVSEWQRFIELLGSAKLEFDEIRNWKLEELSTYLEARANLSGLRLYQGRPRQHRKALQSLTRIIAYVLHAKGGTKPCTLHELLFELVDPYAVISFNYDMIADQTLLKMKALNWTKHEYRGDEEAKIISKSGLGLSSHTITTEPWRNTIPLLKLHGSMHWESLEGRNAYCLSGIKLPDQMGDVFDFKYVPTRPCIVPPIAAKFEIHEGALKTHWQQAVHDLDDAKTWIIWGYSFPPADTATHVLFHAALERHRGPGKAVLVINPDKTVGDRVKKICRKVNVDTCSSIEEFLVQRKELVPRLSP